MPARPGYTDAEDAAIGAAFDLLLPATCDILEGGPVTIEHVRVCEQVAADLTAHIDPADDPDLVWVALWNTVDVALIRAESDDLRTLLRGLLP
jgi:hypothetical protein